jgi:hypothetical protein
MSRNRVELADEFRRQAADLVMKISADISNGIQPGERLNQSYAYWVGYFAAVQMMRKVFDDCVKKSDD